MTMAQDNIRYDDKDTVTTYLDARVIKRTSNYLNSPHSGRFLEKIDLWTHRGRTWLRNEMKFRNNFVNDLRSPQTSFRTIRERIFWSLSCVSNRMSIGRRCFGIIQLPRCNRTRREIRKSRPRSHFVARGLYRWRSIHTRSSYHIVITLFCVILIVYYYVAIRINS